MSYTWCGFAQAWRCLCSYLCIEDVFQRKRKVPQCSKGDFKETVHYPGLVTLCVPFSVLYLFEDCLVRPFPIFTFLSSLGSLKASTFQMAILLQYNTEDAYTVQQLTDSTQIKMVSRCVTLALYLQVAVSAFVRMLRKE